MQLAAEGIRSEWRQMDGNDVLVVHLDRGDRERSPVLEAIEVGDGEIRVSGRGRMTRSAMRLGMLGLANQRVRK